MGSTIFFILLLPLAFPHYIINHQQTITVNGDMGLIQQTCKNTKHYDLCFSSLKSNATSSNTDTKGLALIMIGVGVANATATSSYLSSQSTNDTNLKRVLKECSDKYSYASDSLQASVQDLATETYDYAYMHIMAAADYPNACRNSFRRFHGLAYPQEIAFREQGLKHICDVVLGIVDVLGY